MADPVIIIQEPHWETDPDAWDFVLLDNVSLHGDNLVVDCPLGRDVEKKKAKGKVGGTITDNGENMTPVTIKFDVVEEAHWVLWQNALPQLWARKKGGKKAPVKIYHPKTSVAGITEVYIESIDMAGPVRGRMTVTIECTEWLIAPPDAKKPAAKPKEKTDGQFGNTIPSPHKQIDDMFRDPTTHTPRNVDDIISGNQDPYSAGGYD